MTLLISWPDGISFSPTASSGTLFFSDSDIASKCVDGAKLLCRRQTCLNQSMRRTFILIVSCICIFPSCRRQDDQIQTYRIAKDTEPTAPPESPGMGFASAGPPETSGAG